MTEPDPTMVLTVPATNPAARIARAWWIGMQSAVVVVRRSAASGDRTRVRLVAGREAEERSLLAERLPHRLLPRRVELGLDVTDPRAEVARRPRAHRARARRAERRELVRDRVHGCFEVRTGNGAVDQPPRLRVPRRERLGEERELLGAGEAQ